MIDGYMKWNMAPRGRTLKEAMCSAEQFGASCGVARLEKPLAQHNQIIVIKLRAGVFHYYRWRGVGQRPPSIL
jgi:hypothetical protein